MTAPQAKRPQRLQLWTIYFHPEPTGIAPVSTLLARELSARGWEVEVVAAQPHYPEPRWGRRRLPARDWIEGIRVTRVPLIAGRDTKTARLRQELSFTASLSAASPFLGRPFMARPDVVVASSPSFPALLPAVINTRLRRVPLVLWLHDLLPDGAATTGLLEEGGTALRAARRLERAAYETADRIVVLSRSFAENLVEKGVPAGKIELIYHPATLGIPEERPAKEAASGRPRVISMGNIGLSQGLAEIVRAFEASEEMKRRDVQLTITGTGVEAEAVRAQIRSGRIRMSGLLDEPSLMSELDRADLALVTQSYEGTEFNLPSKLMNFMAQGLPVIAAVNPGTEVSHLVEESGAGWVADSSRPDQVPTAIAAALDSPEEMKRRGAAGYEFAREHFSPRGFGNRFDAVLRPVLE